MEMFIIAAIVVALFLGMHFNKKRKKNAPTKAATPWVIAQGDAILHPQGEGWYINIPSSPGYLAYVAWLEEPRLRIGQSIRMRYKIEGGPIIATEHPESPADCGIMIQRRGDSLSARGKYAGYRWFSHLHMPLTEGEHEFTVALNESDWGPVMSDPQGASFVDCLAEADSFNIVMGGAGGRGHGVFAPTSARFTLHSLTVE